MKNVRREKTDYAVQSVNNAIDVLELLAEEGGELSVSECAAKLGLTKSNASNILNTLAVFGFVEHNKYTGNYRLGVKTFQIAQTYLSNMQLIDASREYLNKVRDELDETSYISVMRENNIIYLNVVETRKSVRVKSRIGTIKPAYASASGKVHLSSLSNNRIKSIYPETLEKLTEHTIGNVDDLLKEIEEVRKQGYAMDIEEMEHEVYSVAAPVYNFLGEVVGAISCSIPKVRVNEDFIKNKVVRVVCENAKNLSVRYGYKVV